MAGVQYLYDADAFDPDGDTLLYSLAAAPAGMTINAVSGLVGWKPAIGHVGQHAMTVRVVDALGLAAEQTVTLTVRSVNRPPQIDGDPLTIAVVNQPFAFDIQASDPDGHVLAFFLDPSVNVSGEIGVGQTSGHLSWFPTEVGVYPIQVNIFDELGLGIGFSFHVEVLAQRPNTAPRIESVPGSQVEFDQTYTFLPDVFDPDPNESFTFQLFSSSVPAGTIAFNTQSGLLEWSVPDDSELVGQVATFQVRVFDSLGAWGNRWFFVQITEPNVAPQITPIPNQSVSAGATFLYDVRASDANGDPLSYHVDAPGQLGLTIDHYGRIRWDAAEEHIAGSPYTVEVTVSDDQGLFDTASFELSVTRDETAPIVAIVLNESQAAIGQEVVLRVHAVDDVGVTGRTLTLFSVTQGGVTIPRNEALPLDSDGRARLTLTADHLGTLVFGASARDAAGNVGIAHQVALLVFDAQDADPPTARILSPVGDQTTTAPVDVFGTVFDDLLIAGWTLTAVPVDGGEPKVIAGGTTPVTNGILARLDPTILRNGLYRLEFTAVDSGGNRTTDSVTVQVDGALKLGNFTLTFVDLEIPVSGIPITVSRTYDTLKADLEGDFGYGWTLDLSTTKVKVELPDGADPGLFGYTPFRDGTRVIVTLPGGREEGFTYYGAAGTTAVGQVLDWVPTFVPDYGVSSQLLVGGGPLIKEPSTGEYYDTASGRTYSPQDPYFGGVYQLQLRNGTTLVLDARTGELYQIEDARGNTLTFTGMGIEHSAGRSVQFERDFRGRITALIDPAGNRITYQYSGDGDLVAVTDRAGATTQFAYLDGINDPEHYLDRIFDPLGRTAARTEYDADGRVKTVTDAEGKTIQYEWNGESKIQHVTDQLGHVSAIETDARGNVVREVDPEGGITLRTYDAQDRLLSETTVVGLQDSPDNGQADDLTTTYVYQDFSPAIRDESQRTYLVFRQETVIDPRGSQTVTSYNGHDQVLSVTSSGSTTSSAYDDRGLLRQIRDASGQTTSLDYDDRGNMTAVKNHDNVTLVTSTYNTYGDVTSTTSATGRTTYFDYDINGNQVASWYFDGPAGDRTQILDVMHYDESNRVTGTRRLVLPEAQHVTVDLAAIDFTQPAYAEHTLWTTGTQYDLTGQVIRSTDQHGSATETAYDLRGQSIQTRTLAQGTSIVTRSVSEDPQWLLSRVVQDAKGRAILTTASYLEHPDVTAANEAAFNPETGTYSTFLFDNTTAARATYTIYDGADRVVKTLQLKDVTVRIVGDAGRGSPDPALTTQIAVGNTVYVPTLHGTLEQFFQSRGVVISSTQTIYDNAGRVTSSFDQYGAETRTTYNRFGEVIQTATVALGSALGEGLPALGEGLPTPPSPVWLVSRTIYDALGRAEYTTDRFELP